jgi:hypothetical protein
MKTKNKKLSKEDNLLQMIDYTTLLEYEEKLDLCLQEEPYQDSESDISRSKEGKKVKLSKTQKETDISRRNEEQGKKVKLRKKETKKNKKKSSEDDIPRIPGKILKRHNCTMTQ